MEQNQQQQDSNKVEKRFNTNLSKLLSIMGGNIQTSTKVDNGEVGNLIDELLKERRQKAALDFKLKASGLLDKKIEFDKMVKQKQKELDAAILEKKKEFSTQMEEAFALIENVDKLHKEYLSSLREVAGEDEEQEETKTEEQE